MLKLTYIETGFHLEHLTQFLEEWVALRVILVLRVGNSFYLEPSTASFLLPVDVPGLNSLVDQVRRQGTKEVDFCLCDAEYIEVSLKGTWLASDAECEEGVFVTALPEAIEILLFKLWQSAQIGTTVVSE